jgi:hypothetical protein
VLADLGLVAALRDLAEHRPPPAARGPGARRGDTLTA